MHSKTHDRIPSCIKTDHTLISTNARKGLQCSDKQMLCTLPIGLQCIMQWNIIAIVNLQHSFSALGLCFGKTLLALLHCVAAYILLHYLCIRPRMVPAPNKGSWKFSFTLAGHDKEDRMSFWFNKALLHPETKAGVSSWEQLVSDPKLLNYSSLTL